MAVTNSGGGGGSTKTKTKPSGDGPVNPGSQYDYTHADPVYKSTNQPIDPASLLAGAGDYNSYDTAGGGRKPSGKPVNQDLSFTGFGAEPMPTNGNGYGSVAQAMGGTAMGQDNQAKEAMLQAMSQHAGSGLPAQAAPPPPTARDNIPGINLGPAPTLTMPSGDYNSYLQQAQQALNFGAIAQPYDQAIGNVTTDTANAVANIGGARTGAMADIAAGNGALQAAGQQGAQNIASIEAAGAAQQQAAAQGSAQNNAALSQALGTGSSGGGVVNAPVAAQQAAAQQYLAAAALNDTQNNTATTNAQIADNQNYGRVVDAKATTDTQQTEAAGRDAKASIGLQKGQSLLQAREAAATNAMGMQQNAMQNALGAYNANLAGWQANTNLGEYQQGFGLQKAQFEAAQVAANQGAEQTFNKNLQGAFHDYLMYGGTQPEIANQMLQNQFSAGYTDPYLKQLVKNGEFSFPQLMPGFAQKTGLGGGAG
jgi:hypothetical protein